MTPRFGNRPLGPQRLKAAALAIVDARVKACREAEGRYTEMVDQGGGDLGSLELAQRSLATERSARMEAECIRRYIEELPAAKR